MKTMPLVNGCGDNYKKAVSALDDFDGMLKLIEKYSNPSKHVKRRDDSTWLPEDAATTISGGYKIGEKAA